jgi:transcriptional regulator NrdR family protein
MKCPLCSSKSHTLETRHKTSGDGDAYVERRRECTNCGERFNTYECYELADVEAVFALREARELAARIANVSPQQDTLEPTENPYI